MNSQNQIVKYVTGSMSDNERVKFDEAMNESASLKSEVEQYKKTWILTNQLEFTNSHTLDNWEQLSNKVEAPIIKILGFDWRKMAASVVLLAAFSFVMYFSFSSSDQVIVADGVEEMTLLDNSTVVIEDNSQLTIEDDFNSESRNVELEGKAFFDVSPGNTPFNIAIASGTISVLGTRFQVRTYNEDELSVELYEGKISFKKQDGNEVILESGNELFLDENGDIQTSELNSWYAHSVGAKSLSFDNKSLAFILEEIKLIYGLPYDVKSRFLKEYYTVTLPTDDLESCIKILSEISDRNFAVIDSEIIIK